MGTRYGACKVEKWEMMKDVLLPEGAKASKVRRKIEKLRQAKARTLMRVLIARPALGRGEMWRERPF